jgi:hypothetical protein
MSNLSQFLGGGGGGLSSDFTLDTFPVVPIVYGQIVRGDTDRRDSDTNFWQDSSDSLTLSNNGFGASVGLGTHTILNETGSGKLYWVTTNVVEAGTHRLIITVDGVEKIWEFTATSSISNRLIAGRSFDYYSMSATTQVVNGGSNFYIATVANSDWDFFYGSLFAVGWNASGYVACNFPGLRYESSIKIEVYASSTSGGAGTYCGGLRQKDL